MRPVVDLAALKPDAPGEIGFFTQNEIGCVEAASSRERSFCNSAACAFGGQAPYWAHKFIMANTVIRRARLEEAGGGEPGATVIEFTSPLAVIDAGKEHRGQGKHLEAVVELIESKWRQFRVIIQIHDNSILGQFRPDIPLVGRAADLETKANVRLGIEPVNAFIGRGGDDDNLIGDAHRLPEAPEARLNQGLPAMMANYDRDSGVLWG
mgnify:CR=1 FL=1